MLNIFYNVIKTKIPQQVYNNHRRNSTVADHDSMELCLLYYIIIIFLDMTLWRFGLQSVSFHFRANQPFSESVRVTNFKTTMVTNYTLCMPLTFLFDVFFCGVRS